VTVSADPFDLGGAVRAVRRRTQLAPKVAIVLGSGLGALAQGVPWDASFAASEIPGIPRSTVAGHEGRLLLGRWAGRAVVVAQGRSHPYEGYTAEEVTRVVRLVHALGVKALVLTNASGGIAARMKPGTLMLVEDQVNLQGAAPGRVERGGGGGGGGGTVRPATEGGGADAALSGPVTPRGLSSRPAYAPEILAKASHAATTAGVRVERGVLGVMLGPSYETSSEITALERMGADAVCMSTAAEAAAACTLGLPVGAISCVTNWAAGKSPARLDHGDVTTAVAAALPSLRAVLERLILALA
jgi:purine-nucleoside phosphorylase